MLSNINIFLQMTELLEQPNSADGVKCYYTTMVQHGMAVHFKYLLIYATISSMVSAITLHSQSTLKPRHTKISSSSTEPGSGSLVTPGSTASKDSDRDSVLFRYINSNSGTCILLRSDTVIEIDFLLHNLPEEVNTYIPKDALVDGDCTNEDSSSLSISWKGYRLFLGFAKTPGGERWYINKVELIVSPEISALRGIQTHGRYFKADGNNLIIISLPTIGKNIKLYHIETLIPTPVGKSYSCEELDIDLQPDKNDDPPPGLKGTLLLRKLRLQPFMYKGEDFQTAFECKPQRANRDETAPIAVGSTLAVAVLVTVAGYGIFRYFKIKNVQYNTME